MAGRPGRRQGYPTKTRSLWEHVQEEPATLGGSRRRWQMPSVCWPEVQGPAPSEKPSGAAASACVLASRRGEALPAHPSLLSALPKPHVRMEGCGLAAGAGAKLWPTPHFSHQGPASLALLGCGHPVPWSLLSPHSVLQVTSQVPAVSARLERLASGPATSPGAAVAPEPPCPSLEGVSFCW